MLLNHFYFYQLSLPNETIDKCLLSALQLEAVTYACQQHDQTLPDGSRAGYLIGDGAGVGKGRTVSGIIFENYLKVIYLFLIYHVARIILKF